MSFTVKLSEEDRYNVAAAIQIAIRRLKRVTPDNPNIKVFERLYDYFAPQ